MLSLPLIAPQNEYTLFLSPHLRSLSSTNDAHNHNQRRPNSSSSATGNNSSANNHQQRNGQHNHNRHGAGPGMPARHTLHQLAADEASIAQRKHNISHFGAGWVKPPGVGKTLAAELEERAEREEQAALERREQMMADLAARQELEEARARAEQTAAAAAAADAAGGTAEGEDGGEGERDLDDEIPDADEEGGEYDDDEDEDEDEDEDDEEEDMSDMDVHAHENDQSYSAHENAHAAAAASAIGEVTFNDQSSLLEGSFLPADEDDDEQQLADQEAKEEEELQRQLQQRYARLEEAELTGVARDEADLGIERDLDDSVPEAGEYQHTDTELDETTTISSSEDDGSARGSENGDDDGDVSRNMNDDDGDSELQAMRLSNASSRRRSSGRGPLGRAGRSTAASTRRQQRMLFAAASQQQQQQQHSGGRHSLARFSGSDRSLRSRDISSLLESSFMDSSPIMGRRLRSANNRSQGGGHR
ncbi:hypothetical protein AAFC00_005222 [Neodothiora populina]|uniref:Apc15p protein-domain-containing protein n=1 Tax=Neodothiora populina TaxID=2781224 RepID=A0ABR3PL99_9PEZI